MKSHQINFIVSLLLIFFALIGKEMALAMNTGFSTEKLLETEENIFLSNVEISIIDVEPKKDAIDCFDVNEKGLIAIGSSNYEEKTICVYNTDGVFQYGYRFSCSGSFGVEWDEDKIIIYFVRSDVALSVDSNGDIKSVLEIQDTIDNNSYWNNYVFSTQRTSGDGQYRVKTLDGIVGFFTSSYSKMLFTPSNGETTVIYDVTAEQATQTIIGIVIVFLFIAIVISTLLKSFIKAKKATKKRSILVRK